MAPLTVREAHKILLTPACSIVELRPDSPAERVGLKLGDVIVSVNSREVHRLQMHEVTSYFRARNGAAIKLNVEKSGMIMEFYF